MSAKGRILGIIGLVLGAMLLSTAFKTGDVLMGVGGTFIFLLGLGKARYG